ncbi:hypothetical protein [Pseudoxanthomonas dokdonensis]|nr:hypothetical protein [Pseudoxanthomonas dokdonensis]
MQQEKSMQALGIAFLGCGASFLAVGIATRLLAFTVLGPVFLGLGVVFLATSRARSISNTDQDGKPDKSRS